MISLEETLPPITNGELILILSSYSCQSKFARKALKFVKSTEIPASFRCNLLLFLFKCLFGFILLWIIIAASFTAHISSTWAFSSSTFALKLSARQTILEIMILFSVFWVTIPSEISFSDLFKGRSFVPTCEKNFWFQVSLSWF